ncbi:hypothetical protein LIER_34407 [Lithospermum erythrorhizon]|uniref:Aminotransferase-like plant mobile domain-containing protein n=1 Tax=Lithospermum erythrorhizon TaxID=34254 RepID=A0AAV3S075_LITER
MPFGEMSITLHDVTYLLGLKIDGRVVHQNETDANKMKTSLSMCLDISLSTLNSNIMKGYAIKLATGSATLAYLYRQLGIASRSGTKGMCGCLVLLEAWIYEYFPKIASRASVKYKETMPRACKWVSSSHDNGIDVVFSGPY